MEIKMIKLDDLKPYENNPRFNDDAVEYVAKSIKEFGFKVPIVIDKDNVIVAGHTRFKASMELGLDEVPCIIANDLSNEQIKAFRLVDNKVSEYSKWDYTKLINEIKKIDDDFINTLDFIEELDISDDDFISDTEITKEKKEKEYICPKCGEKFK